MSKLNSPLKTSRSNKIGMIFTEINDAHFASNNEIKSRYLEKDSKFLISHIKTLEKNISIDKEVINLLASSICNSEYQQVITKLNIQNEELITNLKELSKIKDELFSKNLVLEQINQDQKSNHDEIIKEYADQISELKEVLDRKEYVLQTIEKKYYKAEIVLKKYSHCEQEIRQKLHELNCYTVDPNKKISNVVEENEIIKKEFKELSEKYELLKAKTNPNFQNGDEYLSSWNMSKKLNVDLQASDIAKLSESNKFQYNTIMCLKDCISKSNFQFANLKKLSKIFSKKFNELVKLINELIGKSEIKDQLEIQDCLSNGEKVHFNDIMVSGDKIKDLMIILFAANEVSNEIASAISRNTNIIEIVEAHDSFADYAIDNKPNFDASPKEREFANKIVNISNISHDEDNSLN